MHRLLAVSSLFQCLYSADSLTKESADSLIVLWFVCSLRDNYLEAEAAKYLGEGLRENKGLTALEYAACHHQPSLFGKCQQPLSVLAFCSFL